MGITTKEVKHAMRRPEVHYPGPSRHGPDVELTLSGELAIAHRGDLILTVLWRGKDER